MKKIIAVIITTFALIGFTSSAMAEGDVKKGAKVWKKCKVCHILGAKDKRKKATGPALNGIFDRTAGTVEGFKYSKAMIKAGEDGLTWTEENIAEYLKKPRDFIKKNKMAFPGLKKEADIENLLAYIKSETTE